MSARCLRAQLRVDTSAVLAMAMADLKVALSYRTGFILSQVGPIRLVVLFYFVSRVVGDSDTVGSPEEYFRFAVLGIALATVVEQTAAAAAQQARTAQVQGTLEALATQPVSAGALAGGWLAFPILDSIFRAVLTVAVALPLGFVGASPNWPATIIVIILTAIVFAGVGILGGALVLAFQQGASSIELIVLVMSVVSGTLFPVSVLPHWLEVASEASPMRHALDAMRAAVIDGSSVSQIADQILILGVTGAVVVPLGYLALSASLSHARKTGRLGTF